MKRLNTRPRLAFAAALAALAAGVAVVSAAADSPPNHANRLRATFTETRLVVTDHVADLGIRQVINSGTGTLDGFGAATEMVAVSQDWAVPPCGPGSSTTTVMRRITVAQGMLVLKTLAHQCPVDGSGVRVATGDYQVDGVASTGIFAGAFGSGSDSVYIEPPPNGQVTATISGELHLAQPLGG
jgi:hypothetical protein